jgi:hypothetical protein
MKEEVFEDFGYVQNEFVGTKYVDERNGGELYIRF